MKVLTPGDGVGRRNSKIKSLSDIALSKYSYSWQKFMRTNQEMKAKLLGTKDSA